MGNYKQLQTGLNALGMTRVWLVYSCPLCRFTQA